MDFIETNTQASSTSDTYRYSFGTTLGARGISEKTSAATNFITWEGTFPETSGILSYRTVDDVWEDIAAGSSIATQRLLGRGTSGTGAIEEMAISSSSGFTFNWAANSLNIGNITDTPRFGGLGIGTNPYDWGGPEVAYKGITISDVSIYGYGGLRGGIVTAAYRENMSGSWKSTVNVAASYFLLSGSSFAWYTSPATAIGDSRSWTNRMSLGTTGLSVTNSFSVGGAIDVDTWSAIYGTPSIPSFTRYYLPTYLSHGMTDILPTDCAGEIRTTYSSGSQGGLVIIGASNSMTVSSIQLLALNKIEPTYESVASIVGGVSDGTSYKSIASGSFLFSIYNSSTELVRTYGSGQVNIARSLHIGDVAGSDPGDNNATIDGSLTIGSLTGMLKATAGAVSVATAGTDYIAGGVGTANYVAKFSASGTLANSQIVDNGTTVAINTDLVLSVSSNDAYISNPTSDKDMYLQINDGGTIKSAVIIDGETGYVGIGNITTASIISPLSVVVGATSADILQSTYRATGDGSQLRFRRSCHDTIGTTVVTTNGIQLGQILFSGVNANSAVASGSVAITVEQDGTAGNTYVPGRLLIATGTDSALRATRLLIEDDGETFISRGLHVGALTGAAGDNNLIVDGTITSGGVVRTSTSLYCVYYHVPIQATNPGASGATWVAAGANTTGGWQITSATHVLEGIADVHGDWDGASDMTVEVRWCTGVSNTGGADSDSVDIKLIAYYKGSGDTATKSQTVEVATTVGKAAQYKQFTTTFTLDWDASSNVIEVGDALSFKLNLETDTSEVDNIIVTGVSFYYPSKSVGKEVAYA